MPSLTDGVVVLREFAAGDAPALAAIWSDPDIRARNTVPEPTADAAREWVQRVRARNAAGEAWEWAIVDAASGELAGRRALKDLCWQKRRAVAASWVAPRFRGRRFAGRSLRLAAAHAFAQGLVRVHAECETDNTASIRSMLAAGMRHEGTLRAFYITPTGQALDQHVFGLLPEDLAHAEAFRA
ncbi:MAG: GCN5-related N-acetyltransferase, partial [Solirubrobacterales bacterium]|nr:GCN5-related N-acetyltransferase [Solirubrobacterales bacterium]